MTDSRDRRLRRQADVGDEEAVQRLALQSLRRNEFPRHVFSLSTWRQLSGETQTFLGEAVHPFIAKIRPGLSLLGRLLFGPEDDRLGLLAWQELTTGLTYVLVPSGSFQIGLTAPLRAKLQALAGKNYANSNPEDTTIAAGPSTQVPSLLVATTPPSRTLLADMGLNGDFMDSVGQPDRSAQYVPWADVQRVLSRFDWELPRYEELAWLCRGGQESLFAWGDELPPAPFRSVNDPVFGRSCLSLDFPSPHETVWPRASRFGLQGLAGVSQWCLLDNGKPAVLGGAGECYPWQGTGEWTMALIDAPRPEEVGGAFEMPHALRPIIRVDKTDQQPAGKPSTPDSG